MGCQRESYRASVNFARPLRLREDGLLMADDTYEAELADLYERGLAAEKAGDIAEAETLYREVLARDPSDMCGLTIRLAALGRAESPVAAPPAYVATLFDQTADRFDDMLVEQLGYAVPLMVRDLLAGQGVGPAERMLDLGCGTGLTGESLATVARHIVGVDLSEAMLDIADDRDVYDELFVGEAVAFLEGWAGDVAHGSADPFDLIVATDMLPYLGDLSGLLAAARGCLGAGGHLAVSTETLPEAEMAGQPWRVGPLQRYAHAPNYLGAALAASGFHTLVADPITVRYNEGRPVRGQLVLARRSG